MSGRGSRGNRGAYYKAKYGGGGRGRGDTTVSLGNPSETVPESHEAGNLHQMSWDGLLKKLQQIDGASYGSYNQLRNTQFMHPVGYSLYVDRVQSDPYAPPSRTRVIAPLTMARLPAGLVGDRNKRIALADFITRTAADFIRTKSMDRNVSGGGGWASPKGGAFNINASGQEVLERTSCIVRAEEQTIELRFTVALPAKGRNILGGQAWSILGENLPPLIEHALTLDSDDARGKRLHHISVVHEQLYLRSQLHEHNLIAFIADGSILPRQSGAASLPMTGENVVAFHSPPSLRVALNKLDGSSIIGMGIQRGVNVLTGGGFHGKSTLLEAVQMGVYDHISGDGREVIVTDATAFKIRAEDGRSVSDLDISPFIAALPGGRNTEHFSSEDASGSTSMAANIQEALELGCKTLLIDEDSSATNLLVRDERMQALVKAEPITPFVSKARALFSQHGVSTLIIVGGCGDYLGVADCVIGMEEYQPQDMTKKARQVVANLPTQINEEATYGRIPNRSISIAPSLLGSRPPASRGIDFIKIFAEPPDAAMNAVKNPAEAELGVDISKLEQLVEPGQARFIAEFLYSVAHSGKESNISALMGDTEKAQSSNRLDAVQKTAIPYGDLVAVRRFELGAALNRFRGLAVAR